MRLTIKRNLHTGGDCCVFQKGEDFFYADRSFVPYTGMETMIFPCDSEGNVTDWGELYCDRSGQSLEKCIKEFLSEN